MSLRRVLIVDDEPDLAGFLARSLPDQEFSVDITDSPAEALVHAARDQPEVAVLDINMPGMNGFQLRDRLRSLPGMSATPVVFVTGAESPFEGQIARAVGADSLLIKPVPRIEFRRQIYAALGMVRSEEGALPAMLDRLLFTIAENAESGTLTAVRPGTSKRIVFHDGKIVFVTSNDPRDLIGQALLRTGLISEKDLLEAFAVTDTAPPRLATALIAMRKITPEQSQKVFETKIRESVLDLYLWDEGHARYAAMEVEDSEIPYPLSLSIASIRAEGYRRRRRWREVATLLPRPDDAFERVGDWPPGFPASPGDKLLAAAVERGETLENILVAFRGQHYAISVRLADMMVRGTLKAAPSKGAVPEPAPAEIVRDSVVSEIPAGKFTIEVTGAAAAAVREALAQHHPGQQMEAAGPVPPASPPESVPPGELPFEKAVAILQGGDPAGARAMLLEIARGDPGNPMIASRILEAESEMESLARARGLKDRSSVKLAIPMSTLMGQKLTPPEAFVLSRLAAGSMLVGELLAVCPFAPFEVLSILRHFLDNGTIRKSD